MKRETILIENDDDIEEGFFVYSNGKLFAYFSIDESKINVYSPGDGETLNMSGTAKEFTKEQLFEQNKIWIQMIVDHGSYFSEGVLDSLHNEFLWDINPNFEYNLETHLEN